MLSNGLLNVYLNDIYERERKVKIISHQKIYLVDRLITAHNYIPQFCRFKILHIIQ